MINVRLSLFVCDITNKPAGVGWVLRFSRFFRRDKTEVVKTGAPRVKRPRPRTPPAGESIQVAGTRAISTANHPGTAQTPAATQPTLAVGQPTRGDVKGKQPKQPVQVPTSRTTQPTPTSETASPTSALAEENTREAETQTAQNSAAELGKPHLNGVTIGGTLSDPNSLRRWKSAS